MKKEICDKSMTFDECELAILRVATDKAEKQMGKEVVNSPEVAKIVKIVENFLRRKKLVAYGGTAINSILPKEDQFYNMEYELPDYDFFTPNALDDAKELCDIYAKEGFVEVEAKNSVHSGTFKVFVNFMPVADVTYLHKDIFKAIKKEAIRVAGIYYAPPNFLRMAMYLELSRPAGEISRWEKVLKRLTLLNKNYPLKAHNCGEIDFQRKMEDRSNVDEIYDTVKDTLIDQGVVFFGGYAMTLYSSYMPRALQKKFEKNPDFDVLSEEPETTAEIVKERLEDLGIKGIKIVKKPAIGEIVAPHYEIRVGTDTVAFIYQPIACHSYNIIKIHGTSVKIATIDTMLSFYLAFLYAAREYYDPDRILCMSQYLFKVQQQNRLRQKGLLKRFSINCYGHQLTMEELRAQKSEKYMELKDKKGTKEYEENFLRYRPADKVPSKKDGEQMGKTVKNYKRTVNKRKQREKTKKRGRGGLFY
jgi:hypothetical protein|uniref:Poly(A) polymerase catalytic subunit domain-containing protein n=1 Tax=viral metagenome TaxID=1070528 RepID=A0A6C0HDP3_9ZZZZ